MEYSDTLRKVIDFHGHLCPGLAYGYRAAQKALETFGERSADEEIVAIVENDSCSVDAIQVMTGCSFGKGNLIFQDYGKQVYTFFKRSTGQGIRISVDYTYDESPEEQAVWRQFTAGDRSPEVVRNIQELKTRKVRDILAAGDERVLKVDAVEIAPPPKARIFASLRCDRCGEKVMESRVREVDGKKLCIPCAG